MDPQTNADRDQDVALRIAFRSSPGLDVLTLTGDLDLFTVHLLRDMVWSGSCTQSVLALDLDAVDFLDPRGIACLVAARRWTARRDAEMVLACAAPHIVKLLRICRLDTVLPVVEQPSLYG